MSVLTLASVCAKAEPATPAPTIITSLRLLSCRFLHEFFTTLFLFFEEQALLGGLQGKGRRDKECILICQVSGQ